MVYVDGGDNEERYDEASIHGDCLDGLDMNNGATIERIMSLMMKASTNVSLATTLAAKGAQFGNDLTYFSDMAPKYATNLSYEKEIMQIPSLVSFQQPKKNHQDLIPKVRDHVTMGVAIYNKRTLSHILEVDALNHKLDPEEGKLYTTHSITIHAPAPCLPPGTSVHRNTWRVMIFAFKVCEDQGFKGLRQFIVYEPVLKNQGLSLLADCNLAIALDGDYMKAISRRANLNEKIRDYEEAALDFQISSVFLKSATSFLRKLRRRDEIDFREVLAICIVAENQGLSLLADCNLAIALDGDYMKTDYIDLYQLHWPDRYVPMFGETYYDDARQYSYASFDEQLATLGKAVNAGKNQGLSLLADCNLAIALDGDYMKRLAEVLDAEVKRWSSGKQGNLRAFSDSWRLAEVLDAEVKRWSSGKQGNLRAFSDSWVWLTASSRSIMKKKSIFADVALSVSAAFWNDNITA
nr:aldo-keto reductase [Tanacetum cinerariifolium]